MPCMPVLTTALHPSFTGEWDDEEEVHTSPSAAPASSALGRASQASSRMPSRTASAHQLAPEASDGGDGSASRDSSVGARVRMGGAGGAGCARPLSKLWFRAATPFECLRRLPVRVQQQQQQQQG